MQDVIIVHLRDMGRQVVTFSFTSVFTNIMTIGLDKKLQIHNNKIRNNKSFKKWNPPFGGFRFSFLYIVQFT